MNTRMAALLALTALTVGCGMFRRTSGVRDEAQAHREPATTSVFGTWVLREPDSTAFAGANLVEMELNPGGTFTITATYPTRSPVEVRGTASLAEGGLLTLTPAGDMDARGREWAMVALRPGEPLTLLASAAGNTLVFSPPGQTIAARPSSVWYRKPAAEAAGMVRDSTSKR